MKKQRKEILVSWAVGWLIDRSVMWVVWFMVVVLVSVMMVWFGGVFVVWLWVMWLAWLVNLRKARVSEEARKTWAFLTSLFWNPQFILQLHIHLGSRKTVSAEARNTSLPEISNLGHRIWEKNANYAKFSQCQPKMQALQKVVFRASKLPREYIRIVKMSQRSLIFQTTRDRVFRVIFQI